MRDRRVLPIVLALLALTLLLPARTALAQKPAGGAAPVTIVGPMPVPVKVARVPYTLTINCVGTSETYDTCWKTFDVPAGRRFVVEYVNAHGVISPAGTAVLNPVSILTYDSAADTSGLPSRDHIFQPIFRGTHGAEGDYVGISEKVLLFIEPHAENNAVGWYAGYSHTWLRVHLTGYLEPLQ